MHVFGKQAAGRRAGGQVGRWADQQAGTLRGKKKKKNFLWSERNSRDTVY